MPDRPDQFGYGVNIPMTTARLVEGVAEIKSDAAWRILAEPVPNAPTAIRW